MANQLTRFQLAALENIGDEWLEGSLSDYPVGGDTLMGGIIIAGFGFRASADLVSLTNAFEKAADGLTVAGFAAPADKIYHSALTALARHCDLPLYAVDTKTIKPQTQRPGLQLYWKSGKQAAWLKQRL